MSTARRRSCPPMLAAGLGVLAALALAPPLSAAESSSGGPAPASHAAMAAMGMPASLPTLPGQDAFGAVQEIVRILEADPRTDWSKVDLEGLRQHLIDMSRLTLDAEAKAEPVEGGLAIAITGSGRTLVAIRRMIPAQAHELDGRNGWHAGAVPIADGMRLTVTADDARETAHIRGLGFIGLLVSGAHHQAHHLAMALGRLGHR